MAVAAVCLAIGFKVDLEAGPGFAVSGAKAAAQGLIICGQCCSGDTACWERLKREYEAAYPPRGQIGGVCWTERYQWQKNADGTSKQVWRDAKYTKVRFNETEVLSKEHHGRDAGFEYTVGRAWDAYVRATFPDTEADRGWNQIAQCYALNAPRGGDKYWQDILARATPTRIFWPEYGVADTPEERAADARAAADRKAKLAAEEEARAAAEAARKAAEQRAIAARNARVDTIARQIGPAKRAEAERLAKLNDELAALRPKPVARSTAAPSPRPSPTSSSPPRQCTRRTATQTVTSVSSTREGAQAGLSRANGNIGGSESQISKSLGAASCQQRNQLALTPPPVGTCLACISEKQAAALGWVKGKGWPPPKTEWVCSAPLTYTAERCGTGASKVRQM
ncbi:hypothetical protein [Qipengyuania sediminis]|uniref:hypothetical protein n=1 Tax=Qipengyuania sediminis TaxID=1532023 RepID=UPI001059632D|nr:hypothetical protein [Qipengyuania sediminis]